MEAATDVVAEESASSYAWESELQRTWDAVEETADGHLRSLAPGSWRAGERAPVHVGVRRGVMRALFLVVDCSRHAAEHDAEMKPSRLAVMCNLAADFVKAFFEQNPVSTLAILVMRNEKAETLTPLSSNARQHAQSLRNLAQSDGCAGEASLQNALELAKESLSSVASFVSREVILLSASLTTCDPGDVLATVEALSKARVRCSVFSLLAEVYICKRIAKETAGEYGVALSPSHLKDMMMRHLPPRPLPATTIAPTNALVKVGFPIRHPPGSQPSLLFTAAATHPIVSTDGGYACPQCGVLHAEVPTECPICGLKLLSSTDLSKTYHHLFPLPLFKEVEGPRAALCFGCLEPLPATAKTAEMEGTLGFQCSECHERFCEACDMLLHESIHACPSCQMAVKSSSAPNCLKASATKG